MKKILLIGILSSSVFASDEMGAASAAAAIDVVPAKKRCSDGNVLVVHSNGRTSWNPYAWGLSGKHETLLSKLEQARKDKAAGMFAIQQQRETAAAERHLEEEGAVAIQQQQVFEQTGTAALEAGLMYAQQQQFVSPPMDLNFGIILPPPVISAVPRPSFLITLEQVQAARAAEVERAAAAAREEQRLQLIEQQRAARRALRTFIYGLERQDSPTAESLGFHHGQVGWELFKEEILKFAERRDDRLRDKQIIVYRYLAEESSRRNDFNNFFYYTIGIANIFSSQQRNADSFNLLETLFFPIPGMSPEIQQSTEARHLVSAFLGMLKNFQHFTGAERAEFQEKFKSCFEKAKPYFVIKMLTDYQRRDLIRAGFGKALGLI